MNASTAQVDLERTTPATSFGCGRKAVAGGHAVGGEALDAAEERLVLELLVGEAHERLEGDLVAHPVLAARFQHLGGDEALHQAEHVRVRPPPYLAEKDLFLRVRR